MLAVDVISITVSMAVESCARIEACTKRATKKITRKTRVKRERDDI